MPNDRIEAIALSKQKHLIWKGRPRFHKMCLRQDDRLWSGHWKRYVSLPGKRCSENLIFVRKEYPRTVSEELCRCDTTDVLMTQAEKSSCQQSLVHGCDVKVCDLKFQRGQIKTANDVAQNFPRCRPRPLKLKIVNRSRGPANGRFHDNVMHVRKLIMGLRAIDSFIQRHSLGVARV